MKEAKRFVVKVGSALVTNRGAGLDSTAIARWAEQVARIRSSGKEVILVSSGAIAEGMQRLGWTRRPHAMHELQAAAAVGQMGLVQMYESCFRQHGLRTAQNCSRTLISLTGTVLNAFHFVDPAWARNHSRDQRERYRRHRRNPLGTTTRSELWSPTSWRLIASSSLRDQRGLYTDDPSAIPGQS
jgi:hypothetical protein